MHLPVAPPNPKIKPPLFFTSDIDPQTQLQLQQQQHRHQQHMLILLLPLLLLQPRTKHPFDLEVLKNELPPNTGPPGTVATNKNSSSKNLSHVPCKFFKQGLCQAGNSCPFLHNLDGSLGADKLPCKYFQKGNCKFGLKCALAHFLPDGTRINSRAIQGYRKMSNGASNNNIISNDNSISLGNGNGGNFGSGNQNNNNNVFLNDTYFSQPIDISNSSTPNYINLSSPTHQLQGSLQLQQAQSQSQSQIQIHQQQQQHQYQPVSFVYPQKSADYPGFTSSFGLSNPFNDGSQHTRTTSRSFSFSLNTSPPLLNGNGSGITGGYVNQTTTSPFVQSPPSTSSYKVSGQPFSRLGTRNSSFSSTSYNTNSNIIQGDSAITDEDDEIVGGDDFFCEADYVPGSLGDLILTPQELQRRDSRSQSGTLLVRPNIRSMIDEMKEEEENDEADEEDSDQDRKANNRELSGLVTESPIAQKVGFLQEDVFLME